MGGSYSSPVPDSSSQILSNFAKYLPAIASSLGSTYTPLAQNQLTSTIATQPIYDALNLKEAQNYALPLAQVGQQVTNSNALAGAQTNLSQILGPGGQAAMAAEELARAANPNYYKVQDAASQKATDLLNSYSLTGLSPGEYNAVERANNQNATGTGNLGLNNNTNTLLNAVNFGNAFDNKRAALNTAINTANQTATSAQNTGVSPVNIALGQPNTSTMSNFGTNTYSPTTANTSASTASNATGFGSSVLSGMFGNNAAATSGAYGLAQANAVPNYIPNISC